MNCHDRAIFAANQIPQRRPNVLAFTLLCRGKAQRVQTRLKRFHTGTIVPDHNVVLVQSFEEFLGMPKLFLGRAIKANNDAVEIGDFGQLGQDVWHRVGFKFGIEAGQDQRHFARLRECL